MKKLIVGFTGLALCSGAFAAAPMQALRDNAFSASASAQSPIADAPSAVMGKGAAATQFRTPGIESGGPANDECAQAVALACNSNVNIDITGASTAGTDPLFACRNGGATTGVASVWFTFVPGAGVSEVVIQTCNEPPGGAGDTLLQVFTGTCAALGTAVACSDDNCGSTQFLTTLNPTGLTGANTHILELAGWGAGDEGLYNVDLQCGPPLGACCTGTTCTDNRSPEQCFDAGGVWQGQDTLCANVSQFCIALPACPSGFQLENEPGCGQPQPDNFNAGPNSASCAFTFLLNDGCNNNWCGTSTADDRNASNRDTDWYFLIPTETTAYTACVTAEFFPQVDFWVLGDIDPCATTSQGNLAVGNPGVAVCATQCLLGNANHAIRVTTVDSAGNAQRQGIGCSDYRLSTTCDDCVGGSCCLPDNTCDDGTFASGTYAGEIVTQVNCEALGGVYNGDGTLCANVDCGGACCRIDGSCVFSSQANCQAIGGAYAGEGTACVDVEPCPVCSFEDPNNLDGLAGNREDCTVVSGATDIVNAGCVFAGTARVWTPIACGQTMCGTAPFDGGGREADSYLWEPNTGTETEVLITVDNGGDGNLWFRLQHWGGMQTDPPPANDTACTAGFNILAFSNGNGADADTNDGLEPGTTVLPAIVPSGKNYQIAIMYAFDTDSGALHPCPPNSDPNYRITLECAATNCAFACAGDAVNLENEAACALTTNVNGIVVAGTNVNPGCSTDPAGAFTAFNLGQKVCGTAAMRQSRVGGTPAGALTAVRDLDWYRINGLAAGDYTFEFQAEFTALWFLQPLSGPTGCLDPATFGFQVFQCGDISGPNALQVTGLDAGDYAVLVAVDFTGYAWMLTPPSEELCPSPYQFRVLGAGPPCGPCGDSNCDGSVTVGDIGFFVRAVSQGAAGWNALFPGGVAPCDFTCANDTNGDSNVTVGDIGRFVQRVASGVPCP